MNTPYDKLAKTFTNWFGHMTNMADLPIGYMTKMADLPIYGKNPLKIFFSKTRRLMTLGLGM